MLMVFELCLSDSPAAPGGQRERWKCWQKGLSQQRHLCCPHLGGWGEPGLTWSSRALAAEGSDEDGEGNHRDLHAGGEVAGAGAGEGSLEASLLSDAETIGSPSIYGLRGPCRSLRRHGGIST